MERVVLDLPPPEEKLCPKMGLALVRIGEELCRKLARKAEQFFFKEYVRRKYASKAAQISG